jgi:hypothetical protein
MPIPSSTYTELVTTTLDNYRKTLADNITTHNPLLEKIKRKGNAEPVGGGVSILENLMYAENSTKRWYSGLELLDVSQSDVLTSAQFSWKELNCNVVISGLEKAQNSGTKESVFNLVKSRVKVAEKTMQNEIASALFYSNTENSGKSIGGLQHLIQDLPTASSSVGGINQSTQTWWRNQYYDFSAQSVTPSATTIQAAMNNVFINCLRGSDMPDVIVADAIYFNYYLTSLQSNQRFTGMEEAGAGFKSLKFWGGASDVFVDSNCPASHMYLLNTDYMHYRPHTDFNFVTLDEKWSVNQDATVVPMYWKGNMTVSNRMLQGVVCA